MISRRYCLYCGSPARMDSYINAVGILNVMIQYECNTLTVFNGDTYWVGGFGAGCIIGNAIAIDEDII